MQDILQLFDRFMLGYNEYVGVYLLLALLIPTGVYFAFKFKFLHVTKLFHSFKVISGKYDNEEDTGDISHFKALTTALSATVGTGNIVGVALAIYYGGPGAVFWMWVTGFLGMILKFVECSLSMVFRKVHEDGSVSGGPMYYMELGLKDMLGKAAKVMAVMFAIAAVLCSLGTGNMAQSNSIADAMNTNIGVPAWISGLVIASLVFMVVVGGIKRIAQVTSKLVPFMAAFYLLAASVILFLYFDKIPGAFALILKDAFTGTAATGGFIGSTFFLTLRFGVARGLFSNEAGQGSAAIAHAAAKTKYPIREGLVASVGPLVDTLIICTMTALVIILTGSWNSGVEGVGMTIAGFSKGLGLIGLEFWGEYIVGFGLILFALSTAISWSYYGDRSIEYLLGEKAIKPYRVIYSVFVFIGAIWGIEMVWHFTDMVITFMTIPNLIAIALLSPVILKMSKEYFAKFQDKI
ncbi:MAG: sodium:alanine symporter family protein [Calditrichia bacterium]|nr:sodium:alanine symporter family protein [Calditrichia bacterium]